MSIEWGAHPGQHVPGPVVEHADGGDGWIYRRTTFMGHVSVYRAPRADILDFAPHEREPIACWIPSPVVPT